MQMINHEKNPSRIQSLAYVIECLFEITGEFQLNKLSHCRICQTLTMSRLLQLEDILANSKLQIPFTKQEIMLFLRRGTIWTIRWKKEEIIKMQSATYSYLWHMIFLKPWVPTAVASHISLLKYCRLLLHVLNKKRMALSICSRTALGFPNATLSHTNSL